MDNKNTVNFVKLLSHVTKLIWKTYFWIINEIIFLKLHFYIYSILFDLKQHFSGQKHVSVTVKQEQKKTVKFPGAFCQSNWYHL